MIKSITSNTNYLVKHWEHGGALWKEYKHCSVEGPNVQVIVDNEQQHMYQNILRQHFTSPCDMRLQFASNLRGGGRKKQLSHFLT